MFLRTTWDHVGALLVLIKYEVFDLQWGCMKREKPGDPEQTGFSFQNRAGCPLLTAPLSRAHLAPVPFSFFPLVDSHPVPVSPRVEKAVLSPEWPSLGL